LLVYDGDCRFCTDSARWFAAHLPLGYPVVAWQDLPALDPLGLTADEVRDAAWWIDVSGRPLRGHRAIAAALIACKGWWAAAGFALRMPPISWLAAGVYALVARNRSRLPGDAACEVPRHRS
jgi:predicted DCC family thiol-disulfide oxidoreductase YuxK